jgi:hypothetical protein
MEYRFDLEDEDSLILVDAEIDELPFTLAVDTGATHTVIDLTSLLLTGYSVSDNIGIVPLETGKGSIDAYVFKIAEFYALGKKIHNFKVCAYDFLSNSVLVNIDGVLGLDFYKGNILNIDFERKRISLK